MDIQSATAHSAGGIVSVSTRLAEETEPHPAYWSDVSLITVAFIWGINIPLMKTGLDQLNVFVFNAIRLTISSVVLLAFAWRELRHGVLPKGTVTFKQVAIYSVMGSACYQLLFLLGIARTTSGNTALIISTIPMWTALLALAFIGERLRKIAWCGLVIALVGTGIVAVQKGNLSAGQDYLLGNLLLLAAALFWAGGTVYSKPLLSRISPMQLSAWAAVLALPVHLAVAIGHYESSLPALKSPELWLILIYSGVLSAGLAQPMWSYGVRQAGAAHASAIQNLIPVIAIAAAWFSRGEKATIPQVIGGALILGGLVAMRLGRQQIKSR